eukprot:329074-Chlamydomonas_euryale.AAC.1
MPPVPVAGPVWLFYNRASGPLAGRSGPLQVRGTGVEGVELGGGGGEAERRAAGNGGVPSSCALSHNAAASPQC